MRITYISLVGGREKVVQGVESYRRLLCAVPWLYNESKNTIGGQKNKQNWTNNIFEIGAWLIGLRHSDPLKF